MKTWRVVPWLVILPLALPGPVLPAAKDAGRGEELRNVEVMDPTMRLVDARRYMIHFNKALGVQCRDCHVLKDFASDDKPLKLVAREMMKMQAEINETWFPGRGEVVTCISCHRGERKPTAGLTLSGAAADSLLELQDLDAETKTDAAPR